MPIARTIVLAALSALLSTAFAQDDCGRAGTLRIKVDGQLVDARTREFSDGSIAVRAALAVNPDGGAASYTVRDHGFTYIANGLALWRNGRRESCGSECMRAFRDAETRGFAVGTAEFCVFAMKVEPLQPGGAMTACNNGLVAGNGKGRPLRGASLTTVTGDRVEPYVSTTSLQHLVDGKPEQLDSESLPIAVTPTSRPDLLGKIVWVAGTGFTAAHALIGDAGPAFGEGSIALHQLLRHGEVRPQKPGPIPRARRCEPEETGLQPPFESRPDGGAADRCRPGHVTTTGADIRAYRGISQQLDFVVLGRASFPRQGRVIQRKVDRGTIGERVGAAGYDRQKILQMLACLPP